MKRGLNKRKDERLCDWCDRLAAAMMVRMPDHEELRDILGEVSKQSYIEGVNTERELQRKWRGWE